MFALASLVLVGTAQAQQTPDTIFGMELNAPISIPECQYDRKSRTYFPAEGSCYKRDQIRNQKGKLVDAEDPLSNERLEIYFAHKSRPAIVAGSSIWATTKGGELASVGTRTGGIDTQAQNLAQLEEKFGKPTRVERPSLQNVMGATYEGLVAEWELPSGTYVKLESPDMSLAKIRGFGGLNVGTLSILTASVRAKRETEQEAEASQRTKL